MNIHQRTLVSVGRCSGLPFAHLTRGLLFDLQNVKNAATKIAWSGWTW
jgi:hypothetical protein